MLPLHHVLVVDDNRDAADSLAALLTYLGATAVAAYDGPAALEALVLHAPNVVFLDLTMPGMDGYDVARQIRADPRWAEVTLVALTGWGADEDRRRSRLAGFDHHLIKPADLKALRAFLQTLAPAAPGHVMAR